MKKLFKQIIASVALLIMLISLSACNTMSTANYGKPVRYKKDVDIEFPDFKLTYQGERKQDVPVFGPGYFLYYDFKIENENESKTVSWSSGTGEIGPSAFEFNGKQYLLEMKMSDILGKLNGNRIVIWEQQQYADKLEKDH